MINIDETKLSIDTICAIGKDLNISRLEFFKDGYLDKYAYAQKVLEKFDNKIKYIIYEKKFKQYFNELKEELENEN